MLVSPAALKRFATVATLFAACLASGCVIGGNDRLEDRTSAPTLPGTVLEQVAALDYPPGNIAVSATGRIFFTYHPDGDPPDLMISPRLAEIGLFEFHRAAETIALGRRATEKLLPEIREVLAVYEARA